MTTCHGCRHYRARYESCGPLGGQLHCPTCDRTWNVSDRIGCPRCAQIQGVIELAECPGAVPSAACPGREEPPKVMEQGRLF